MIPTRSNRLHKIVLRNNFTNIYVYLKAVLVILVVVFIVKLFLIFPRNGIEVKFETRHEENEIIDVNDRLVNLNNFTFLMSPGPCAENLLLVTVIHSNPVQFINREVIRKTWGRPTENNTVVFLLGTVESVALALKVQNESSTYGDIIQGNFLDSYRNMTYKHVMGMKWVAHFCSTARYMLKADDDVYVNTDALIHFLSRNHSPWPARDLIAGKLYVKVKVKRESSSKYMVTKEEYAAEFYPTYCDGFAILYSQDVVSRLLFASLNTPFFWIDDVYVTGVLADKISVDRISFSNLVLDDEKTLVLIKKGYKYAGEFIVALPHIPTNIISIIFQAINS